MSTLLIKRLVILITLMQPVHGFLQTQTIGNETVIANLLAPQALKSITKIIRPGQRIRFNTGKNSDADRWLAQILTDSCLERNYLVYSSADSVAETDFVIEIANVKTKISYRPAGQKLLILNKGFRRSVTAEFRLIISDQHSRIWVNKQFKAEYTDIIPASVIRDVENKGKSFTTGTKKQSTFINRWLEPVIITTATATVVFLFYSLRSDN